MGSSLDVWKTSEMAIRTTPRGRAAAPTLVVIAASPPTCRPAASRASLARYFPRGLSENPRMHQGPTNPHHHEHDATEESPVRTSQNSVKAKFVEFLFHALG
jgi:hypothetical protein